MGWRTAGARSVAARDELTDPCGYLHRKTDRSPTYSYNIMAVGSRGEEGEAAAVTVP